MNDQPGARLFALANVVLIVALFVTAWQALGFELLPGVVVHDIGSCALDWHRERPALVLACAGRAMIEGLRCALPALGGVWDMASRAEAHVAVSQPSPGAHYRWRDSAGSSDRQPVFGAIGRAV